MKRTDIRGTLIKAVAALAMAFSAVSCAHTRKASEASTAQAVRADTVYVARNSTDTLVITDSVLIDRGADTVFVERARTVYKTRARTDTVYKQGTDTEVVHVPYEKPLTQRQEFLIKSGRWAWWLLIIAVIATTAYAVARIRRK